jgi:lysophospholipase L1-like esterase
MKPLLILVISFLFVFATVAAIPPHKTNLFLVGDSTMAIKKADRRPETGWGEKLRDLFKPSLIIHNHAVNGRSSKSFIAEGRWQTVIDQLQPGDFVFIQFGHNDQKANDPTRFTNPYSSYRKNLHRYVEDTRSRQATPILLSSIVRRNFNEAGTLIDDHGPYPAVMRELASYLQVDFIDLNTLTESFVSELGVEESAKYYLHVAPRSNNNYPDGKLDNTHLNPKGAKIVAQMVTNSLCEQSHNLSKFMIDCK